MKISLILPALLLVFLLTGCAPPENDAEGKFEIGNMYSSSIESDRTYFSVLPIEWTGENPATIESLELIKENGEPVTFEEDGIAYEFFGADPLKRIGLYSNRDIGKLMDITGFEIEGEGRIVMKLRLGEVAEDPNRKLQIDFTVAGEKYERTIEWDMIEVLSTN